MRGQVMRVLGVLSVMTERERGRESTKSASHLVTNLK